MLGEPFAAMGSVLSLQKVKVVGVGQKFEKYGKNHSKAAWHQSHYRTRVRVYIGYRLSG